MCSRRNSWAGLSDSKCVAELCQINEVCNGLSKSGTRYLWRGNPTCLWGDTLGRRTHTSTAVCQTKRIAGGVQMVPQYQDNRWIGTFFYDVCPFLVCFSWRATWDDRISCQIDRQGKRQLLMSETFKSMWSKSPNFFHLHRYITLMTEPTLETETILLLFLSHKTNIVFGNGGTGESASANIAHYFPVWVWVWIPPCG